MISKPADKTTIPVSAFIGEDGRRMREGLCHRIALKPFKGGKRIAIIDDADALNEEGANALLKTLEEPPPQSLMILIGTSADKQLPTIRSRCQLIRFRPLDATTIAELLLKDQLASDPAAAAPAAAFSDGSLERARELADPNFGRFANRCSANWPRNESLASNSGRTSAHLWMKQARKPACGAAAPGR